MNLLQGIYPEIILSCGIILIILGDIFLNQNFSKKVLSRLTILIFILSLGALILNINLFLGTSFFFNSNIVADKLSMLFKIIFLLGGIIVTFLTMNSNFGEDKKSGEFYSLLLGAILGASLVASSNNLILFYLAFEMLSICSYVMAGLNGDKKSLEAALKYAVFGASSSAMMIFGFSYLYGLTGTLDISAMLFSICDMITLDTNILPIILSVLLVFVGVGYKICAFPFHFWAPDVYEGAPSAVSAFLSVISKATGFLIFIRFISFPQLPWYETFWNGDYLNVYQMFIAIIAVCSMCYGNFVAIRQDNLKRLMGYSSIAQAGYMLLALSSGSNLAVKAVVFYLLVYFFMNFVLFSFINFIEKAKEATMENIKGVGRAFPVIGGCVFIALISLAGIPPTGGFSGKFLLFNSVIDRALSYNVIGVSSYIFIVLAIIGVLNSVVSLYYYMKIAKNMFFYKKGECTFNASLVDSAGILSLAIPILLLLNFSLLDFLYN